MNYTTLMINLHACQPLRLEASFRVIDALKADLRGLGTSTVSCPRQVPSCGVVRCTYDQWFQAFSDVGPVNCQFLARR